MVVTTETPSMKWMEWCAVYVIVFVTAAELFITLGPYFGFTPVGETASLAQQVTIIQNVFISIVAFLIGASAGTRKKDDTIQTQSSTIATAQAALTPNLTTTTTTTSSTDDPTTPIAPIMATVKTPDIIVPLHAGDTATVQATPTQENKT